MQSQILTAHPEARLRVYAIWVDKQVGDARSRWDAAGLIDPRVAHLWDAKDVSGAWLAGNVPGYQGSEWDTYLLFGPEATWTSQPSPLRSSGAPVFDQIQQLSQALDRSLPHPGSTTTPPRAPDAPPPRGWAGQGHARMADIPHNTLRRARHAIAFLRGARTSGLGVGGEMDMGST